MPDNKVSKTLNALKHKAVVYGLTALSLFGGVTKVQASNNPTQDNLTTVLCANSSKYFSKGSDFYEIFYFNKVTSSEQNQMCIQNFHLQKLDNGCVMSRISMDFNSNMVDADKSSRLFDFQLYTPDGKMYVMNQAMDLFDIRKEMEFEHVNEKREVVKIEKITQEQAAEINSKVTKKTLKTAEEILKDDLIAMEAFKQYLEIYYNDFVSDTVEIGHTIGFREFEHKTATGIKDVTSLRAESVNIASQHRKSISENNNAVHNFAIAMAQSSRQN